MVVAFLLTALFAAGPMTLTDGFGRDVTIHGVTLVDWQGEIANPAVRLRIDLPADAPYPCDVYVHGSSPRIHFDRADADDRSGIGRRIRLADKAANREFHVTIFPDRDGKDERHQLVFQLFDAQRREQSRLTVPVRVIDEDVPVPPAKYPILLEYEEDRTGYFQSPAVRRVLRQVADDWSSFLDDQGVDPTPAGDEPSQIFNPDGFVTSRRVTNRRGYRGFLIYVSGIQHAEMRAGGTPSLIGKPQTSHGQPTPLRRSGTLNFDTRGNWNQMGWRNSIEDDDWWVCGNLRQEQSDFYSIALHEMGHALAFEGTYPRFGVAKKEGLRDPQVERYLGLVPKIDASDHFPGVVDPVSGYGGFGMEYLGWMKERRWLITKAHLLCLQAVGYRLRPNPCFEELRVSPATPPAFRIGKAVIWSVPVTGGVPDYCFKVVRGELPAGLALDSFSGAVSGTPTGSGTSSVEIEVDDQDPTTPPQRAVLEIRARE
jgi:hypothetical protein